MGSVTQTAIDALAKSDEFHAPQVETMPREQLAGPEASVGERTVDVQINRLRRKIEDDPGNPLHLQTVRGVGYRLRYD